MNAQVHIDHNLAGQWLDAAPDPEPDAEWYDDLSLPTLDESPREMARHHTVTRAVIEARLAENPRISCEDCGCEEGCIAYLRDLLAELAN